MKPLAILRNVLTWMSVLPTDEHTSKWQRVVLKIIPMLLISGILSSLTSSSVFFWKFVSIDLEVSLYALIQVMGQLNMFNIVVVTLLSRHKIQAMFSNLDNIFNAIKDANDGLFVYLKRTIGRIDWGFWIYTKCSIFLIVNILISVPIVSVVYCLTTNGSFDAKFVYYPFKHVLPWGQRTPLGYIFELIFEFFTDCVYGLLSSLLFLLFISMCLFHATFYEMFRNLEQKLDRKGNRNTKKLLLCDLIRFHMSVKRCFVESANVYSPYILVQFITYLIFMACNVFQLELTLKHIDLSITILVPTCIWIFFSLFFYCLFGKLATESFLKMGDCLYDSNWAELPVDLQKYLILMIENMQKPIYYHGYEMAVLNLEIYTKCLKTVFSYYMMFKTLTSD